ncbi:hypothetical protein AB3S75_029078 [Citrus x aurantiifolia]
MAAANAGILLTLFGLASISPILKANIHDFDEVWQKRAGNARRHALEAYHPNPEEVVSSFNKHVLMMFENGNSTRRYLRGRPYTGRCAATNPIDQCWRCDRNWANNRKRLADCAQGFGRGTIGGKNGPFYVVTNPADDDLVNPKPGTLRHAVIQERPLWITFAHDMVIRLSEELLITSDKTIDARGSNVQIYNGAQITMQFVKNIIIHGLHIRKTKAGKGGMIRDSVSHYGFRSSSDGDGISMFGASHIWIDHVSMSGCQDGLIDAVMGSTAITVSNSHFTHQDHVMLLGASDGHPQDSIMQVTVAFNHFGKQLVQRMPRVRFGFAHVVNNDYTHWLMYAIGGSQHPTILSQGNRFLASNSQHSKEVTKRDSSPQSVWKTWNWRSEMDLMMNGAFFVESGSDVRNVNRQDVIPAKPGKFASQMTRFSGALNCYVNKPC